MHFRFSRRAQADIEEIGDYIARDNPKRAATFTEELRARCREMTDFLEMGSLHSELGAGIRLVTFKYYLIFYVVRDDMLEIKRVLHHARNVKKIMRTE